MRIHVFGFIGERTKRETKKMGLPRREYFIILRYLDEPPVLKAMQEFPGLKDRWNGTTHFNKDSSGKGQ